MKRGPATIEITIATMPAIRTSTISAFSGALSRGHLRERFGDALEPHGARALDEHAVAGAEHRLEQDERLLDRVEMAAAVRGRLRADRDDLVDTELGGGAADLGMPLGRVV